MTTVESLRAKLAQKAGEMSAITAAAEAENRALTPEETQQFQALDADFKGIENSIASHERAEEIQAKLAVAQPRLTDSATTTTQPPRQGATSISGGTPAAHGFANHGFKLGFGEFLLKVREAATHNKVDPRLMVNSVSTFGGEQVGADGGFALPPDFARGIQSAVIPEDSFLRALNTVQTNSNLLVVPADEDTPWSSSGIVPAKTAEGAAISPTKAVLKKVQVVMHSVKALCHISEESLSDIPFLASFVQQKMGEKLRYKVENYVVNGTGEDEPLGFLNAPGLLALAETSTAAAISAYDIFNMKASALSGTGAFWVMSPTVLPAIWALKSDATAGYPLYTPDMRNAPEGGLLGLPVFRSEACPAINTAGDIMLVVPGGYIFAMNGGVNTASTIAFAFDQQLQSFRASVRIGGAPLLSAKVTRANGSTYASHLVALAGSRG